MYNQLNAIQSHQRAGNTLFLDCGGPRVAITALTEKIIRVRLAPQGSFNARRSWAITPPDESFPPVPLELTEKNGRLVLSTAALSIQINCAPCRITFHDLEGRPFCADTDGLGWSAVEGFQGVTCAKRIEPGENFYGFGERTGRLNQLGQRLTNWATDHHRYGPGDDPLYIAIPVCLALRPQGAYGVFLNNTWHSCFDLGAFRPGTWTMEAEGGELDYYVIYGPTPAEVLAGFGQILGTTPLPPLWALGYHQSRWSYGSEAQVRELAAEFRRRRIPCDVIHLDIDYMDGYRDFTWNAERFPDPPGMIADLKQAGFRLVAIVDSGVKIDPAYEVYRDGLERHMFIQCANGEIFHGFVWPDDSVFPDYTRPEVRQWWGEKQQRLIDAGISGIWNDMNEPTVFTLPFSQGGGQQKTIDPDTPQGPEGERTFHAEVHNLYGSGMAQASYEGLRRHTQTRPFVLTRSGYAGIQRWSACWMGDNMARWDHLEMAIPQLLNMGLSGVPFVGTDIGGFFDNAEGELFARWMQFGALMPFSRGHSHTETGPHEPWAFGPRVEAICREYLQLRYRLLPYFYTLFWETSRCGTPVLRPLFYEYPDDAATYQIHDQVLLGPWLLAAPVYQPGQEQRPVYLPAGEWYDWWTEKVIVGPIQHAAHAPLERLPLYVRAGAILPSRPDTNYTEERHPDTLTLDIYPGNGTFTLYEDDGHSFDYERGQFCTTRYQVLQDETNLKIEIGARSGSYHPSPRGLLLRIHGIEKQQADRLPTADYDSARRILTLQREDDGQGLQLEF